MPSRFDYVKYDEPAISQQAFFKSKCETLEQSIIGFKPGRAQSLALTKLEEVYMWVGKMIRDEQIARNGAATLQEERKNG